MSIIIYSLVTKEKLPTCVHVLFFTNNFYWELIKRYNISQHYIKYSNRFSWCRWSRSLPLLSPSHPASESRTHDVNTAEAPNEGVNESSVYL